MRTKRNIRITACAGGNLSGHTHDANITWIGVSSLDEITGKGNYYLKNDIEYAGTFQPDDGVVLCLNGKNITCTAGTSSKAVTAVTVNKTFTLTDCRNVQGKVTHGAGKIGSGVMNNGTFNLYGGSVSGNTVPECLINPMQNSICTAARFQIIPQQITVRAAVFSATENSLCRAVP